MEIGRTSADFNPLKFALQTIYQLMLRKIFFEAA